LNSMHAWRIHLTRLDAISKAALKSRGLNYVHQHVYLLLSSSNNVSKMVRQLSPGLCVSWLEKTEISILTEDIDQVSKLQAC
jgi:hypothetical protein